MEQTTKSELTLINRNGLSLSGVKKVISSEPTMVVIKLENCNTVISGSNLAVQNLSIKEGILELGGVVNQIKYTSVTSKRFSVKNMFR
ncbi:MAG: YabP/YqfC family sporulation protein [Firmicutes bacterium]|nr:YabP/YqfC family sporulation protein [Bacillota bacterium]